jgi:hypothetical protein
MLRELGCNQSIDFFDMSPMQSKGCLAAVTDTVERVLGRSLIGFDRWPQENTAAFIPHDKNIPAMQEKFTSQQNSC